MAQSAERQTENTEAAAVSAWKRTKRESFMEWEKYFFSQASGQELSDTAALLDVANSIGSRETVYLEENGGIGARKQWNFLTPIHKPVSLSSIINESFPALMPQIDSLAAALGINRDLVLQGIIQTNVLLDHTRFDRLPALGEDLGAKEAALIFKGSRLLRLMKFSPPILLEGRLTEAVVGYYSAVKIRERGLGQVEQREREKNCYSLIFSLGFTGPVDFANLFRRVLCFSTHAVVGDSYYRLLQQEKSRRHLTNEAL